MTAPIPVTVVTGFLGAGKSTLVERWLDHLPADRTAVIINERGEVGIDAELLADRVARIREITGGCFCCVTQAALDAALVEISTTEPRPTRIIVETSGAASPAGVVRALTRGDARDSLRLDGIITVVDASRAQRALAFDLAVEQLGFADVVVMSHADRCDADVLGPLEETLRDYAPGAVLVQAQRGRPEVEGGSLGTVLEGRAHMVPDLIPHGHEDRHGIDAASFSVDGELDEERFTDWVQEALGAVEARILRVKGIVAIAGLDARVIVQGVGEAVEVSVGRAWAGTQRTSRFVVVGLGLSEIEASLRAGFEACHSR